MKMNINESNYLLCGRRRMDTDDTENAPDEPFQIPIEGQLDLHTFNPRDIKELLPAFFTTEAVRGALYRVQRRR